MISDQALAGMAVGILFGMAAGVMLGAAIGGMSAVRMMMRRDAALLLEPAREREARLQDLLRELQATRKRPWLSARWRSDGKGAAT